MLPDVTTLPEFAYFVAARDSRRWFNASCVEVPEPTVWQVRYTISPTYAGNYSAPVEDADMYRTLQDCLQRTGVGAVWRAYDSGKIIVFLPHMNFEGIPLGVHVETPEERRSRLQAEIDEEKREAFLDPDDPDDDENLYGDEDELEDDLNDFEDEDDEDDDYDGD